MNTHQKDQLWDAICKLSQTLVNHALDPAFVCLSWGSEPQVWINEVPPTDHASSLRVWITPPNTALLENIAAEIQLENLYAISVLQNNSLDEETLNFLKNYLAYCFISLQARKQKRAIAIAHFAQSLDGKIATNSGDSKWIGNDENLTHAHRMRALCDGIMIGTGTLQADKPSLTVRHVPGDNPIRIVISNSARDFSSLLSECDDTVLVMGSEEKEGNDNVHYIQVKGPHDNGNISCQAILACLFTRGIYSVYIEGGSATTSNFLKDQAIDLLQLHISPQVFGSGITGLVLPEIDQVKESVNFQHFRFVPVGDTFMFVGEPTY